MLVVETIAKIRRAYFGQGKAIKAICRELNISRKVMRKVLRSNETAFEYERSVQPMPKLGAWKGELDRMLSRNETRPARERLTLIRIFEELRGLDMFARLHFAAFQFFAKRLCNVRHAHRLVLLYLASRAAGGAEPSGTFL